MAFFTERMETLTNDILKCRSAREASVTRLKIATAQILTDCRSLLKNISEQSRARATQCRKELAHDRKSLVKHVQMLRATTRREQLRAGKQLREMLSENCADRQEQVRELLHGFARSQKSLAGDLQGAARNWRAAHSRHAADPSGHGHPHHGKEGRKDQGHKKGHGD